jgi:Ca2+-binding RTX toxin-like protein
MASATSVPYSGNNEIDGILSGVRWSTLNLTYSFAATGSASVGNLLNVQVQTLSTIQQDAIRSILKMAESITGLRFTQVADTKTSQGTLRFGESATELTASGYYPSSQASGGDAWFNLVDYNSPRVGSYAFLTMMHEIGHTFGLDHAHEGGRALPANHDSLEYSVMTYRSYAGGPSGAYTVREGSYPRSFMLNDLAALQYMYGGNYGTNSGNTTYKWNASTGELSVNGAGKGAGSTNTILETIWDGGGNDTYDFSNYATGLRVDINPGGWTTTNAAQLAVLGSGKVAVGNIATAYLYNGNTASMIENVKGGTGNDSIVGNAVANMLEGGNGSDTLYGGGGKDTLTGGNGNDFFVFNTALSTANTDSITDFRHDADLICLDDAIFRAIGTVLDAAEFYARSGATAGRDANDYIVYDTGTGRLFYDADGNKAGGVAAILFATLSTKPVIDFGDFAIV